MLCIRSEPTTASFTDDMTAFQFNPAKSMWTLLIAAVVWTATNMISGIKASSGRDFPSFKSPTGGQRPPMRSDVFITCNVFAIASRFIYYAARPMSWAHAHHVHTMPPNVGYAALSTGIPSTNDNELKKCPAFMMLDMLIIVALEFRRRRGRSYAVHARAKQHARLAHARTTHASPTNCCNSS